MGDHLGSIHFVFFSGRNIRQIRQICQILLISLNYEKTQLNIVWLLHQRALCAHFGPKSRKIGKFSLQATKFILVRDKNYPFWHFASERSNFISFHLHPSAPPPREKAGYGRTAGENSWPVVTFPFYVITSTVPWDSVGFQCNRLTGLIVQVNPITSSSVNYM